MDASTRSRSAVALCTLLLAVVAVGLLLAAAALPAAAGSPGTASIGASAAASADVPATASAVDLGSASVDGVGSKPTASGGASTPSTDSADGTEDDGPTTPAVPTFDGRTPQDGDGDGRYEDVNGDGRLSHYDVVLFFRHHFYPAVQDNGSRFDYNGNGVVGHGDVATLFRAVALNDSSVIEPRQTDDPDVTVRVSQVTADPLVGDRVAFDASNTTVEGGTVAAYAWDFDGDGVPEASGLTAATSPRLDAGPVRATVRVRTEDGHRASASASAVVAEPDDLRLVPQCAGEWLVVNPRDEPVQYTWNATGGADADTTGLQTRVAPPDGHGRFRAPRNASVTISTDSGEVDAAAAASDPCSTSGVRILRTRDRPHDGTYEYPLVGTVEANASELETETATVRVNDRTLEATLNTSDPTDVRFARTVELTRQINEIEVTVGNESDVVVLDGDGLTDVYERRILGTDPRDPDSDSSRLPSIEADDGTLDGAERSPASGLPLVAEAGSGSNPFLADTDGDGLPDDFEFRMLGRQHGDPTLADSDGDGTPDPAEDPDEDGLTSLQEYRNGTAPLDTDTDGDGLTDAFELERRSNASAADTDDDGLDDRMELWAGTDAREADSDGDGIVDGNETHEIGRADESAGATVSMTRNASRIRETARQLSIGVEDDDVVFRDVTANASAFVSVESSGPVENASLTIEYEEARVGNESNLSIYRYDEVDGSFDRVNTTVNAHADTATVVTDHFSNYVVIDEGRAGDLNASVASEPGVDTDGDGLTDVEEIERRGQVACPDPTDPDSDDDGVPDGEDDDPCDLGEGTTAAVFANGTGTDTQVQLRERSGTTDGDVRVVESASATGTDGGEGTSSSEAETASATSALDAETASATSALDTETASTTSASDAETTSANGTGTASASGDGTAGASGDGTAATTERVASVAADAAREDGYIDEDVPRRDVDTIVVADGPFAEFAYTSPDGPLQHGMAFFQGAILGELGEGVIPDERRNSGAYQSGKFLSAITLVGGGRDLGANVGQRDYEDAAFDTVGLVLGSADLVKAGVKPFRRQLVDTADACLRPKSLVDDTSCLLTIRASVGAYEAATEDDTAVSDLPTGVTEVTFSAVVAGKDTRVTIDLIDGTWDVTGPDVWDEESIEEDLDNIDPDQEDPIDVDVDASFPTPVTATGSGGGGGGGGGHGWDWDGFGGGGIYLGGGIDSGGSLPDAQVPTQTARSGLLVSAGSDFTATVNQTVDFAASVSTDGPRVTSLDWNFEDGGDGQGLQTTHTFDEPGVYRVQLVAEDAVGHRAGDDLTVTVVEDTSDLDPLTYSTATLQENVSSASPGSVVTVGSGTYTHLNVDTRGLTLVGEGDVSLERLEVTAPNVTVQNVRVRDGVHLAAPGARLYHSRVVDPDDWAVAAEADDAVLQNVTIRGQRGLYTPRGARGVSLLESTVSVDGEIGVRVGGHGRGIEIRRSTVTAGDVGIRVGHATGIDLAGTHASAPRGTVRVENSPPALNLSVTERAPSRGERVGFEATGSADPDGDEFDYYWDVDDDGEFEYRNEPFRTRFAENGTWTVTLVGVDQHGARAAANATLAVGPNEPPAASWTVHSAQGRTVSFDATATTDPDQEQLLYQWSFGDGTTRNATDGTVVHEFPEFGEYAVELIVRDGFGGVDVLERTVDVDPNRPPDADAGDNRTVFVGERVEFDASGTSDPDAGDDLDHRWRFGDGSTPRLGERVAHRYDQPGEYRARLEVLDDDGGRDSDTLSVTVEQPPFEVAVEGPNVVEDGRSLQLAASVDGLGSRSVADREWQLGNGTTATGSEVRHAFDEPGTYRVHVTVATESGEVAVADHEVTVVDRVPTAAIDAPASAGVDVPVRLSAGNSSDPDGRIETYAWDLDGDGDVDRYGRWVNATFDRRGTHAVRLRVVDDDGRSNETVRRIAVRNPLAEPSISVDPRVPDPGESVRFTATAAADGGVASYEWDLRDDGRYEAEGRTFEYTFDEPGTWRVGLRVTDDAGHQNETVVAVRVDEPPTAALATPDPVAPGETVTLDASGSSDADGSVVEYAWDLDGDGATERRTETATTTASFAANGTHDVRVRVVDGDGATDDASAVIPVGTVPLRASGDPSVRTDEVFGGFATPPSLDDESVVAYEWHYGDGDVERSGSRRGTHIYAEPGDYTVTVRAETDLGRVATATHEVTVEHADAPGRTALDEGFEAGVGNWDRNGTAFERRTDRVYEGNASAGAVDPNASIRRLASTVVAANGTRPSYVSFYFNEDSNSNSGQVGLYNANGSRELAFRTENPQWQLLDAAGRDQVYGGDGYDHWIHVELLPQWANGTYRYRITDLRSGATRTGQRTLEHGRNLRSIRVTNPHGDFRTWVDELTVHDGTEARFGPVARSTRAVRVGEAASFDASWSRGQNRSFEWEFGDGASATGPRVQHRYAEPGTYEVELTVTSGDGSTDANRTLVRVENGTYREGFEDGLVGWSDEVRPSRRGLEERTDRTFEGGVAAGARTSVTGTLARDVVAPNGTRPSSVSFYYNEDSNSNSGQVGLYNANGSRELAFRTENPQWQLLDAGGRDQIYDGDGYDHWIRVELLPHWTNGTYRYRITDLRSGATRTGQRTLEHGRNLRTIRVTNPHGDFRTWIDELTVRNRTSARLSRVARSDRTVRPGEPVSLDAYPSVASDPDFQWEFGDGEQASGVAVDHRYDEPGIYDATLRVTDASGRTDATSTTITVVGDSYAEGFEDGLAGWTDETARGQADLRARSDRVYSGQASAGVRTGDAPALFASDVLAQNGTRPTTVSFYYNERQRSNGARVEFHNTDGELEAGFGTNNPQWNVLGPNGYESVYDGDGYDRWVRVELNFHWQEGTYGYHVTDLQTGTTRAGERELRHGEDVRSVRIENHGGDSSYTWFDDFAVENETEAVIDPVRRPKRTIRTGETVQFDGSGSSGQNLTYRWRFDAGSGATADGATDERATGDSETVEGATGKRVTNRFETPGTHRVRLRVTDDAGRTDVASTRVRVEGGPYRESFEDGLAGWAQDLESGQPRLAVRTDRVLTGERATGVTTGDAAQLLASDVVAPNGTRPTTVSFYYNEQQRSNGARVEFHNTDGELEAGFGTNNPQWEVLGPDGYDTVYGGDGYDRWVRVELTFHWANGTYGFRVTDLQTDENSTGLRELREGVDLRSVRIENHGGDSSYTWFDDIALRNETRAVVGPLDRDDRAPRVGEAVSFDGGASSGRNLTWHWSFGDGTTSTGAQPTHSYEEPGTYEVELTVTDESGVTDAATTEVTVSGGAYAEGFEDGLAGWTDENGLYGPDLQVRMDRAFAGRRAAGAFAGNAPTDLASDAVAPNGSRPTAATFYYNERSDSSGTRVEFHNADGEVEAGVGTDNPEWEVLGPDGYEHDGRADGYDRWVRVDVSFHWTNGTYGYRFTDLATNRTETGLRELRHGDDVRSVRIENHGGGDVATWLDEFSVREETRAVLGPLTPANDTFRPGEPVAFDAAASSGRNLTYTWRFDDGATGTGVQPTHSYESAGEYEVELVVTARDGTTDVATTRVLVQGNATDAGAAAGAESTGDDG